jgi:CubicO group peptidase (beta-lactamase class C family)
MTRCLFLLCAGLAVSAPRLIAQTPKPPSTRDEARPWHVRALGRTPQMPLDSAVVMLERDHFAPEYLARTSPAERLELVGNVRQAAGDAGTILVNEDQAGVHIHYRGGPAPVDVNFTIGDAPRFAITTIQVVPGSNPPSPAGPALTWESIPDRLSDAAAHGFSGQVLVRRGGKEVLRKTYGFADRESKRLTGRDMIYCIGSEPIDFTVIAARLLMERGKLRLDDSIGRYLAGVPADKAGMTIRMILERRSGLPDFHHADDDWDRDLAYIDRATAVRRILAAALRFPPGTGQAPSHSSFGLLAAIVESASGMPYRDFVRSEILRPLGMTRTGFYGETLGLSAPSFAVGYGPSSVGLPNIPPNWGPTSWLVMGSGGMMSTLDDLVRFHDAVASGALFADKKPRSGPMATVNGSDRGYLYSVADNGSGDQVFLISNTETHPDLHVFIDGVMKLVMDRR